MTERQPKYRRRLSEIRFGGDVRLSFPHLPCFLARGSVGTLYALPVGPAKPSKAFRWTKDKRHRTAVCCRANRKARLFAYLMSRHIHEGEGQ